MLPHIQGPHWGLCCSTKTRVCTAWQGLTWCNVVWQRGNGAVASSGPGLDFWLCHLLAMRPWVLNYWISPSLHLLICKKSYICRSKWDHICETPNTKYVGDSVRIRNYLCVSCPHLAYICPWTAAMPTVGVQNTVGVRRPQAVEGEMWRKEMAPPYLQSWNEFRRDKVVYGAWLLALIFYKCHLAFQKGFCVTLAILTLFRMEKAY